MPDQILIDLDKHIENTEKLSAWLDAIYYNNEFGTMITRPLIGIVNSGVKYVADNLRVLKTKYIIRQSG